MRRLIAAGVLLAWAAPIYAQRGTERAIHENSPYYPNSYVYHSYAEPDWRNGNWPPPQNSGTRGPAGGMYYGYGYNPGYYTGGYPVGAGNSLRYSSDGRYRGRGSPQFPNSGYSGYVPYGDTRGSVAAGWR
jgi:hypothetical protein